VIRTLIFDLGRVLVPFEFLHGYKRMSAHCGLEPDEIRRRLGTSELVTDFESGAIDGPGFHRRVEELLETKVDYAEFCDMWFSVFEKHELVPDWLLKALRKNYRLVLLSNTNPIHYSMLYERYPVLKNFDAYILSHEVGAMKPLPKIYAAAIAAAGCRPEECFFTDDVAEYVAGARAAGIDAVQFVSAEETMKELRARGVSWE